MPAIIVQALTISAHGGLDRIEFRDDLPVPELRRRGRRAHSRSRRRAQPSRPVRRRRPAGRHDRAAVDSRRRRIGCRSTPSAATSTASPSAITSSINPGLSDRTCEYCRAGEQPLCPRFGILGEHSPGTLAEYVVVPAANVRAIPSTDLARAGGGVHARDAHRVAHGRVARARAAGRKRVDLGNRRRCRARGVADLQADRRARLGQYRAATTSCERAGELGADELLNRNTADVAARDSRADGQARRRRRRRQRRRRRRGSSRCARSADAAGS